MQSNAPAAWGRHGGSAPGYYRFILGDAVVTIISDGRVYSANPTKTFLGATPEEIGSTLAANFLETDRVVLDENVAIVDFDDRHVMFDCGVGTSAFFGRSGGKLLANMSAAGISPAAIDAIVLSHAHPDHIGALMDAAGEWNFPNAQLYLSQEEFDFWTSAARTGTSLAPLHEFVLQQLMPNRDRLHFIRDGQEILPGIQALASPGHTVGHMHFEISSAGKALACTADLTRHQVLGLENPWEFTGDYDPKQSLESLRTHLGRYADERIPILSYHYPWPGLGHVARWGEAFRFIPTGMDMS